MLPANLKIRVALALKSLSSARELEWLFPTPRQEELFNQDGSPLLLDWSWDEVLYGLEGYAPNFCLSCYSKLGMSIGGKISYSCYHCKGRTEQHGFGVTAAKGKQYYLQYSLGYSPELVQLLIGEVSKCQLTSNL